MFPEAATLPVTILALDTLPEAISVVTFTVPENVGDAVLAFDPMAVFAHDSYAPTLLSRVLRPV